MGRVEQRLKWKRVRADLDLLNEEHPSSVLLNPTSIDGQPRVACAINPMPQGLRSN